jgi:hypothetical protein
MSVSPYECEWGEEGVSSAVRSGLGGGGKV